MKKKEISTRGTIGGLLVFLGIFGGLISSFLPTIFKMDINTRLITISFLILFVIGLTGLILIAPVMARESKR